MAPSYIEGVVLSEAAMSVPTLLSQISGCLLKDQFRLRRRLQNCKSLPDADKARQLERLAAEITQSAAAVAQRKAGVPAVSYPQQLPVAEKKDDIKAAIAAHQVVIIAGETGSGKTTQLPKICLELGRGISGMIGHTQPRRLAARSVCDRIAEELQCQVGAQVGYKIRFGDHTDSNTYIKLMTDGILLAEIQQDRFLNQ